MFRNILKPEIPVSRMPVLVSSPTNENTLLNLHPFQHRAAVSGIGRAVFKFLFRLDGIISSALPKADVDFTVRVFNVKRS